MNDQDRALRSLEVFVDIEHTYIGDLVVELEHNGTRHVLANRTGGDTDDMKRTFSIPDVQGTSFLGSWTLYVDDQADGDVGTLRGWELIAR